MNLVILAIVAMGAAHRWVVIAAAAPIAPPPALDWSARGKVTPVVNNSEMCAKEPIIAVLGAIESAYAIAKGVAPVPLSPEQITDCNKMFVGNGGAVGGAPDGPDGSKDGSITSPPFQFPDPEMMQDLYGWIAHGTYGVLDGAAHRTDGQPPPSNPLCSVKDYPVDAIAMCSSKYSACKTACTPVAAITGYGDVPNNDTAVLLALQTQPLSVVVEISISTYATYKGGVLSGHCVETQDSSMLLVGYGNDGGMDYWKLRSQWGAAWGELGYLRIERGQPGQCGITMSATYPIGACQPGHCDKPVPPPAPPPSPPPTHHECHPFQGCTVDCKACCSEFIPDGDACDICNSVRCNSVYGDPIQ